MRNGRDAMRWAIGSELVGSDFVVFGDLILVADQGSFLLNGTFALRCWKIALSARGLTQKANDPSCKA
jgi:hypothetical protein